MYKTLCAALLLLPTFALTQNSRPASAPAATLSSPQIVAKGKFPNQTASIPTTAILTPKEDGLYRLSVYATLTVTGSIYGNWNYNLFWTDDAGPQSIRSFLLGYDSQLGQFFSLDATSTLGGPVAVFEAKAGQPITYSVTQGGPPDGSAYSLYFTLERLE